MCEIGARLIGFLLGKIFPPKLGEMSQSEVDCTLRLLSLRSGGFSLVNEGPPEAGVLGLWEWSGKRWVPVPLGTKVPNADSTRNFSNRFRSENILLHS